jgi:HEAT repeat protein
MRTMKSFASVALLLACGGAAAAGLADRVTQQDGWVAWQVPMVEGAGVPCCFDSHWHRGVCDLESSNWSFGTSDEDPQPATAGDLGVYVHVAQGRIDRVRALAASCTLRNTDKVRRLDAVAAADSVALLAGVAASAGKDFDSALSAAALHADAGATRALEQLAAAGHPQHLREQALFWLAQARGVEGARIVERVASGDGDAELRANAVFALSQAHGIDGYASIHAIAQHDASEHVREQALFWMAQTGDARAKDDIVAAIDRDASPKVREQGVFALSQLKHGDADAALIALVRGRYPREVKRQALFWLGESGSEAALKFLDDVLTRADRKPASG